jgi:hypothetical protein
MVPERLDELYHRNKREQKTSNMKGMWSLREERREMSANHKARMCPWVIKSKRGELRPGARPSRDATTDHSDHTVTILSSPLRLLPMMAHHRGDDLEDDFMPDETVALSEDEALESLVGDQDDVGKLLSADEGEQDMESPTERTKAFSDEKKRKRREKEKERKAKECPFKFLRLD